MVVASTPLEISLVEIRMAAALMCLKIWLTKEFGVAAGSERSKIKASGVAVALAHSEVSLKKGFEMVVASTHLKMSLTKVEMAGTSTRSKILPKEFWGSRGFRALEDIIDEGV